MSTTAPPKPKARKENPANAEYEKKAKALIRYAIQRESISFDDISARLSTMGVEISPKGVENKISRGGFSAAFLMQVIEAVGAELVALSK